MRSIGVSAPTGVGEMEYYQRIRQGMDRAGQGMASAISQSDNYANAYQKGATLGAVSQVGNTVGMSHSGLTNQQSFEAGKLGGMSQGINMQQQSAFSNNGDYYKGVERGARQQLEKTRGMGLGSEPKQNDWDDFARQSSGQFQETFAGARGYKKEAMDGNNLKKDYAAGLETTSAAKVAGIKGLGGLSDENQDHYVRATQASSAIKAHQMIGDTAGQLQEFSKAMKESGKELSSVVQELSQTMAQAKTRASIEGIDQVGANSYITNAGRSAAGQQQALKDTIRTADQQYGNYEKFMGDSASINTGKSAGSTRRLMNLSEDEKKSFIDDVVDKRMEGKAISLGKTHNEIEEWKASYEGQSYKHSLNKELRDYGFIGSVVDKESGTWDPNTVAKNGGAWAAALADSHAGMVTKMSAISLDGATVTGNLTPRGGGAGDMAVSNASSINVSESKNASTNFDNSKNTITGENTQIKADEALTNALNLFGHTKEQYNTDKQVREKIDKHIKDKALVKDASSNPLSTAVAGISSLTGASEQTVTNAGYLIGGTALAIGANKLLGGGGGGGGPRVPDPAADFKPMQPYQVYFNEKINNEISRMNDPSSIRNAEALNNKISNGKKVSNAEMFDILGDKNAGQTKWSFDPKTNSVGMERTAYNGYFDKFSEYGNEAKYQNMYFNSKTGEILSQADLPKAPTRLQNFKSATSPIIESAKNGAINWSGKASAVLNSQAMDFAGKGFGMLGVGYGMYQLNQNADSIAHDWNNGNKSEAFWQTADIVAPTALGAVGLFASAPISLTAGATGVWYERTRNAVENPRELGQYDEMRAELSNYGGQDLSSVVNTIDPKKAQQEMQQMNAINNMESASKDTANNVETIQYEQEELKKALIKLEGGKGQRHTNSSSNNTNIYNNIPAD